jgi:hypothetical protein
MFTVSLLTAVVLLVILFPRVFNPALMDSKLWVRGSATLGGSIAGEVNPAAGSFDLSCTASLLSAIKILRADCKFILSI